MAKIIEKLAASLGMQQFDFLDTVTSCEKLFADASAKWSQSHKKVMENNLALVEGLIYLAERDALPGKPEKLTFGEASKRVFDALRTQVSFSTAFQNPDDLEADILRIQKAAISNADNVLRNPNEHQERKANAEKIASDYLDVGAKRNIKPRPANLTPKEMQQIGREMQLSGIPQGRG